MTRPFGPAGGPRAAVGAALLLVVAWLSSPVWTPVHVEGFSASIQSLAMHLAGDDIRRYDLVYPLNLQFFATSRYGAVLAAALGYLIAPASGEWPMRIMMWAAFAVMLGAGVVLVRRWAAASSFWALLALVLMPGTFESAFFYNDNVLSSALLSVALVLLTRHAVPTVLRAAGAGAVFGLAVLARADALILLAAAACCLVGDGRALRPRTLAALGFTAALLVPVIALPAWLHFTLLDTLRIANTVVQLWNRGSSLEAHGFSLIAFVGWPGAVMAAIGVGALIARRSWWTLALLAGVPVVYNLVYLGKMWQPRQLLPLAPFLAGLIAIGLQALRNLPSRRPRQLAFALIAIVWLLPPRHAFVQDGPHTVLGRFWTPMLWHTWQHEVRADFDRLQALVAGLGDNALLVTDVWDSDRFLHLTLQEAGYHIVASPGGRSDTRCTAETETFARGAVTIRHLRLHVPFIDDWELAVPRKIERQAGSCAVPAPASVVYVAGVDRLLRGRPGFDPSLGRVDGFWSRRLGYRSSAWVRLDRWPEPVLLNEAREAARRRLLTYDGKAPHPDDPAVAAAMRPVLTGFWTSGGR